MRGIKLKDFDRLVESVQKIERKIADDAKNDRLNLILTFILIVSSVGMSVYTIQDNEENNRRNLESQAYAIWSGYLKLAAEQPHFANGLERIDTIPIESFCVKENREKYPAAAVAEYVKYAWFVANGLGAAEMVLSLQQADSAWTAVVHTLINDHINYIRCEKSIRRHYSPALIKEIDIVLRSKKKQ
jgi:hypothetical protein